MRDRHGSGHHDDSSATAGAVLDSTSAIGFSTRIGFRRQLLLSAYWFPLSFQGGALPGVAIPTQLLVLTTNSGRTWSLGLLIGVTSLVGTLVQPLAGAVSDLSWGRWGRRRPYLVAGALLNIVGLALMAIAANLTTLWAGALLSNVGSGIATAVYQAYVPDHVPAVQYGEASGYIGAMTMLGTIASFALAGILVAPGATMSFYLVTIAITLAGTGLTAIAISEPQHARAERPHRPRWRELWIEPWRDPDFAWVFTTRSLMMLALYMLFTFVEYYVRDVIRVTQFVQGTAVVAGIATLAAVIGGVLTGILSDRVGRKPVVSAAGVLMAAALTTLALVHRLDIVLGVGVVFGLALGAFAAVDWALAIDALPDLRFAAKDLGLWSISTNLPQTVAPVLGGAVLLALAPYGAATGFGVLFLGSAACAGISSILVWRVRGVR